MFLRMLLLCSSVFGVSVCYVFVFIVFCACVVGLARRVIHLRSMQLVLQPRRKSGFSYNNDNKNFRIYARIRFFNMQEATSLKPKLR